MWWSGNATHQTPSDIFVHGSKVFIRSVDALYCIGSETAHSPIRVPRTEN
jgi:hypothetical protein